MTAPRNRIIVGDASRRLKKLAPNTIDLVVTSPPYFKLRDYQVDGQLGLEAHVDQWVDHLVAVARELQRLLTPTGTLWLNLGDTYSTNQTDGAPRKGLLLGPERVALRLTDDGWILRNKVVWRKANPMPTSVRDRLACTWEVVYVFAKSADYFFGLDAIRVPHTSAISKRERTTPRVRGRDPWRGPNSDGTYGLDRLKAQGMVGHPLGKNPGDVWQIASSNYRGSHRATFPITLAERIIRAGCPEARCTRCHAPWRRRLIRSLGGGAVRGALGPDCTCGAGRERGTVLDPFIGSGTTAIAAERLGRDWLGVELSPAFAREANDRITSARSSPRAA